MSSSVGHPVSLLLGHPSSNDAISLLGDPVSGAVVDPSSSAIGDPASSTVLHSASHLTSQPLACALSVGGEGAFGSSNDPAEASGGIEAAHLSGGSGEHEGEAPCRWIALVTGSACMPPDIGGPRGFVQRYKDFRVCVATSALETGISLVGHYTDVLGAFRREPVLHASQAQMVARVRDARRAVIWAEEGDPYLRGHDAKKLQALWAPGAPANESPSGAGLNGYLLRQTLASVATEKRNVLAHNRELWVKNFAGHEVPSSRDKDSQKEACGAFYSAEVDNREMEAAFMRAADPGGGGGGVGLVKDPRGFIGEAVLARIAGSATVARMIDLFNADGVRCVQLLSFVGRDEPRAQKQDDERFFVTAAVTTRSFCIRLYLYMLLVDYHAGLALPVVSGGGVTPFHGWVAVDEWMRTCGSAAGSETLALQRAVLEVLRAAALAQQMFGSLFHGGGRRFSRTPATVAEVKTFLSSWRPPAGYPLSALTGTQPGALLALASIGRPRGADARPRGKPPPPGRILANSLHRMLLLPTVTAREQGDPCFVVARWSANTLGVVAAAMMPSRVGVPAWIPAPDPDATVDGDGATQPEMGNVSRGEPSGNWSCFGAGVRLVRAAMCVLPAAPADESGDPAARERAAPLIQALAAFRQMMRAVGDAGIQFDRTSPTRRVAPTGEGSNCPAVADAVRATATAATQAAAALAAGGSQMVPEASAGLHHLLPRERQARCRKRALPQEERSSSPSHSSSEG